MRTTVTLDDDLLAKASKMMGGLDRSTVLHEPTPGEDIIVSHSLVVVVDFYAIIFTMKTTIDSAGRIVVPKSLRQALNIKPGQTLEIRAGDGRLEIEITATPMTLKRRGKDVVAVPDVGLPKLTADAVRETLEHIRR